MDFAQVVQTFGFPGACVVALGWYLNKITSQAREDSIRREQAAVRRETQLFAQLERFGKSLEDFNVTLVKIDSRLEHLEKKVE